MQFYSHLCTVIDQQIYRKMTKKQNFTSPFSAFPSETYSRIAQTGEAT
ncbi:hypothetical protein HMPREF9999_01307 [Alloprevotella sp. oral taxon 473 str. F0040]|nr:hypothetical protein HMPREF9999_01307 [Alloprevotella sp. oral taxon 473 str. F0040]